MCPFERRKKTHNPSTSRSERMHRCFIWQCLICSHYPFSIPNVVGHTPTLIYIYDSYTCLSIACGAACGLRQYFKWALVSLKFELFMEVASVMWKISFPTRNLQSRHQIRSSTHENRINHHLVYSAFLVSSGFCGCEWLWLWRNCLKQDPFKWKFIFSSCHLHTS